MSRHNRFRVSLAAAVVAIANVSAAPLGAQQLARIGDWSAFKTSAANGTAICGVSIEGSQGRGFYLKYFDGSDRLVVQIFKESWRIPRGTEAEVLLRIDNNNPWIATASGSTMYPSGIGFLEMSFSGSSLQRWVQQFRLGNRLVVAFPDGSEAPWIVSLVGTNAIMDVFVRCLNSLSTFATQPFGDGPKRPAPTTNTKQQETQPFR